MAAVKTTKEAEPTLLDKLKTQAQLMGVDYLEDITERALRAKLLEALGNAQEGDVLTNAELEAINKDSNRLMRCIVTPMAAHTKNLQGQLFSVGNSRMGFISKYVLFNEEYHIPKIIYDHIKEVETQFFVDVKVNGERVKQSKMAKAFGIQDLPPLTEEELKELAKVQYARNATA